MRRKFGKNAKLLLLLLCCSEHCKSSLTCSATVLCLKINEKFETKTVKYPKRNYCNPAILPVFIVQRETFWTNCFCRINLFNDRFWKSFDICHFLFTSILKISAFFGFHQFKTRFFSLKPGSIATLTTVAWMSLYTSECGVWSESEFYWWYV